MATLLSSTTATVGVSSGASQSVSCNWAKQLWETTNNRRGALAVQDLLSDSVTDSATAPSPPTIDEATNTDLLTCANARQLWERSQMERAENMRRHDNYLTGMIQQAIQSGETTCHISRTKCVSKGLDFGRLFMMAKNLGYIVQMATSSRIDISGWAQSL